MRKKLRIRKVNMKHIRVDGSKVHGVYYPKKKLINIEKTLKGENLLTILSHELLHAALPHLNERQVYRASKIIANAIWKRDFRLKNKKSVIYNE
jgi:hypothetical protein